MAVFKAQRSEKRYLALGRYPGAAHALLRDIREALKGGQPIDGQALDYLLDAICKILNGVDANRALYLTARAGRQGADVVRDARIFYRVQALLDAGKSQRKAFDTVAFEEHKNGHTITDKGVERIFRAHRTRIEEWTRDAEKSFDRLRK